MLLPTGRDDHMQSVCVGEHRLPPWPAPRVEGNRVYGVWIGKKANNVDQQLWSPENQLMFTGLIWIVPDRVTPRDEIRSEGMADRHCFLRAETARPDTAADKSCFGVETPMSAAHARGREHRGRRRHGAS